ncbi:MAG TPA: SPFH domain-containing protein [Verrucomicrobiae bacterium]|jgi:regulator of protease activity HflC (stomatin/prohibitin superfamily)|nr:SPFH domain-containing protein [Verrucomicrobiae bacterium]
MDSPAAMMFLIIVVIIAFIVLGGLLGSFFTINTAERGVVERFNKFSRVAGPGLSLKLPFAETVHKVDMRVQELPFKIETKTKDNVFVVIPVSVQYQVLADKVSDAYYKLTDPEKQIESYVYNVILGHVPKLALDEAYLEKDQIAKAVKDELDSTMENFGFSIVRALVTDIVPDARVKTAMNEINAARREQEAALAKGEADKTIAVKKAEAEAESKRLQGEGIAAQRKAIIAGLKESVEDFQKVVEGTTARDVMTLVLLTQYLDTLKEIGASSNTNTVMLSHSPSEIQNLRDQISQAIAVGDLVSGNVGKKQ